MGYKKLNTTLVYTRAHDQTVAEDYYMAMQGVERHMSLLGKGEPEPVTEDEREELLALAQQLA
ncbi:MAG: hypothetical protein HY835_03915, partial [Anaerolineae bacterium]|nr:hypothetical protein [Anaerolineae bacterium]